MVALSSLLWRWKLAIPSLFAVMPYSETSSGSSEEEDPPALPPRTWRRDAEPRRPRPTTIASSCPMDERRRGMVEVPSITVSPAANPLGTSITTPRYYTTTSLYSIYYTVGNTGASILT